MLKRLQKKCRQRQRENARRLAAVCTVLGLILSPTAVSAYAEYFSDGGPHTVNYDITAVGTGLCVTGSNTSASMTGHSITAFRNLAQSTYAGAYAFNHGRITLNSVTILSSGDYGRGLNAFGGTISMTGGIINTVGEWSSGAYTENNGDINLNNVAITTSGNYSRGLNNVSGTTTMNGGSITTVGTNAFGAYASGGIISLNNVSIHTTEMESDGLYNAHGTATMTGGSITTASISSDGAEVNGGIVSLNNVDIRTNGYNSNGLLSNAGTATMTGGSITTVSDYGNGAVVNGGIVSLNNVDIRTNGINSHGLLCDGGTITMIGGSIVTTSDMGYGVTTGAYGNVTLNNVAIQAAGNALDVHNNAIITANITGRNITGDTALLSADSGTINVTASGGSQLSGRAALSNGGMANLVLNNSTWTTPDHSALTTLSLNTGRVHFLSPAPSGPYHTLTVRDLTGSGSFYLNANLTGGNSDLIHITGSSAGNHQIYMTNLGSPTGLVKVIDIGDSAINTATFMGGGDSGPYRYGLAQGSSVASSYSGLDANDYYFYNTGAPSTSVRAAVSAGSSVNSLWYGEMNDIKKRMGELRLSRPATNSLWARTYGAEYQISPAGGSDYTQRVRGLEIGRDRPAAYSKGQSYTGAVFGGGWGNSSFSSGGSGSSSSFYAGGYKSWLQTDGSYLDLIGKYNWFSHDFTSPVLGGGIDSASFTSKGFGLSAEIGKRYEQKNGYFAEPQIELSAFWADPVSYTTANGLNIVSDRSRSLQLRLGGIAGKQTTTSDGTTRQLYGKLSWVEEFAGDSKIRVNAAPFVSSLEGGRLVAGFGYAVNKDNHQVYLDFERAWGNITSIPWGFNAGCRWNF